MFNVVRKKKWNNNRIHPYLNKQKLGNKWGFLFLFFYGEFFEM